MSCISLISNNTIINGVILMQTIIISGIIFSWCKGNGLENVDRTFIICIRLIFRFWFPFDDVRWWWCRFCCCDGRGWLCSCSVCWLVACCRCVAYLWGWVIEHGIAFCACMWLAWLTFSCAFNITKKYYPNWTTVYH